MADTETEYSSDFDPHSEDAAPRTEELLGEWGRRAGRFLAAAAARTREEAEDIFAEAQSIRRGDRS